MDPFSHLGKSFLTSWVPGNSQPVTYPSNSLTIPDRKAGPVPSSNLPVFPPSRLQDANASARGPPSYDPYIIPNKRVRHSNEEFSDVHHDVSPLMAQPRDRRRLESQIQSQINSKPSNEGLLASQTNLRKNQNPLSFGAQDSSILSGTQNLRDIQAMMLLKQQMDRPQKDTIGRENPQNQIHFPFQNDTLYYLLANNASFAHLFQNAYPNNSISLGMMRQLEAKQAMQQLNQYYQLNQQMLYNLNEPAKLNVPFPHNQSDPILAMPPLDHTALLGYINASSLAQNGLNNLIRAQTRGNLHEKNDPTEKTQNKVSNLETNNKDSKLNDRILREQINYTKQEERSPLEPVKLEIQPFEQEVRKKNSSTEASEDITLSKIEDHNHDSFFAQRMKISQIKAPPVIIPIIPKEPKDPRRKNKWQIMLETEEPDSSQKSLKRLSKHKKLQSIDKEILQDEENLSFKNFKLDSSYRKKKKGDYLHKNSSKLKNLQGRGYEISENQLFGHLDNHFSDGENRISITNSYGKKMEDFVLDETDQKIINTKVGKEFQAKILDLDFGDSTLEIKRVPKLIWEPETFDSKTLEQYFTKLQEILGNKDINEEKAIKMLAKKSMIPEEVIVTIKKNEKFYSSFLGNSHCNKQLKHKKSR